MGADPVLTPGGALFAAQFFKEQPKNALAFCRGALHCS
jgi:hypothetical protein